MLCVPKDPKITLAGGTTGILLIVRVFGETTTWRGMWEVVEKGIRKGRGHHSLKCGVWNILTTVDCQP